MRPLGALQSNGNFDFNFTLLQRKGDVRCHSEVFVINTVLGSSSQFLWGQKKKERKGSADGAITPMSNDRSSNVEASRGRRVKQLRERRGQGWTDVARDEKKAWTRARTWIWAEESAPGQVRCYTVYVSRLLELQQYHWGGIMVIMYMYTHTHEKSFTFMERYQRTICLEWKSKIISFPNCVGGKWRQSGGEQSLGS